MKKMLIIGALVVGTLSAHPQGTVFFADRQSDMTIHIFAPQINYPIGEVTGNQGNANGTATGGVSADIYEQTAANGFSGAAVGVLVTGGNTVYTGGAIGNTLTSNPTPAGLYHYDNGSDYTVQMYAAPGLNVALSALSPVSQYVTVIATSSVNGGTFKNVNPPSDPGIPNTSGGSATIALFCWYNGGTGITLAQDEASGVPWGVSAVDNLVNLGDVGGPPPANEGDLLGFESFAIVGTPATITPEPNPIALASIGGLLFAARKWFARR